MGFRTKLILSYAAIIFLTLLLALALVSFVVQQTQQGEREKTEQRLKRNAELVVDTLTQNGSIRPTAIPTYARAFESRILLIAESGDVLLDSEPVADKNLTGKHISGYKLAPRQPSATSIAYRGNFTLDGVNNIYFAVPTFYRTDTRTETDLVLSVPEAQLAFNWGSFLQGLAVAASIALLISIGAAYFLARSIARPLIRMTRASEAIAQGDYNHRIEGAGKGEDEVSRLGLSFNRMAEEVARSQQTMRDFVANVSHELKTPLTSIQGFSQAVLDGTADSRPMVEHSVTVIYDEAARMRRLVDELLDLSRIESGQIEFNRRELDLRQLLERLVIKLGPQAVQKGISFNLNLDAYQSQLPGPRAKASNDQLTLRAISDNNLVGPLVWGDADRLEQVFTNIIDNAIKYSPERGEVVLELKLLQVGEHTGFNRALVTISNSGPLIPVEQLPRIFERFYKLDKSRAKKKGDSTGLGLAIVKELLEAHNGTIQVQSQPLSPANYPFPVPVTEGLTTFTISLPLVGLPKPVPALPESIPALPQ